MRWDELFADLAAQLDDAAAAELAGEVADRTRREIATLTLVDRARAAVGHPVRVQLLGPEVVSGLLLEVGAQWVLLRDDGWTRRLGALDRRRFRRGSRARLGDAARRRSSFLPARSDRRLTGDRAGSGNRVRGPG